MGADILAASPAPAAAGSVDLRPGLERALAILRHPNAGMVPPDGGSPSQDDRVANVADDIEAELAALRGSGAPRGEVRKGRNVSESYKRRQAILDASPEWRFRIAVDRFERSIRNVEAHIHKHGSAPLPDALWAEGVIARRELMAFDPAMIAQSAASGAAEPPPRAAEGE